MPVVLIIPVVLILIIPVVLMITALAPVLIVPTQSWHWHCFITVTDSTYTGTEGIDKI